MELQHQDPRLAAYAGGKGFSKLVRNKLTCKRDCEEVNPACCAKYFHIQIYMPHLTMKRAMWRGQTRTSVTMIEAAVCWE
jgi:hypothetical protein